MKPSFQILLLVSLLLLLSCSKNGEVKTIDPIVAYGDIRNGFASIMDIVSDESYNPSLSTIKNRLIILNKARFLPINQCFPGKIQEGWSSKEAMKVGKHNGLSDLSTRSSRDKCRKGLFEAKTARKIDPIQIRTLKIGAGQLGPHQDGTAQV